jgi:hypothetical protein
MGFKTSLFALAPDVPRLDLLNHPEGGPETARVALERALPGTVGELVETADLAEGGYPQRDDLLYVATFGPTTVFGGQEMAQYTDRLRQAARAAGMQAWELNIHSVVDLCQFEVTGADGQVIRSFNAYSDKDPDDWDVDAVGDPLPFELPYRAGEHSDAEDDDPWPFHPLELGEAALAWMFGTIGEGAPDDSVQEELGALRDPFEIPMHGFAVGGPRPRRLWSRIFR